MSLQESEIYAALQPMFNKIFRRQDIPLSPELTGSQVPGWDSFKYVKLVIAAEDHFGVTLDDVGLGDIKNIGDLVKLIAARSRDTG
jgi:acyl carrier protein